MQVVENHDDRLFGRRLIQQRGDRIEQLKTLTLRLD
jgi:hypothetical protein